MEFSKAFDCLTNELLAAKPDAYDFSTKTLALTQSYLYKRKQRVKVNRLLSEWKDIDQVVPQRSVMGPLLFSVYETLTEAQDPFVIGLIHPCLVFVVPLQEHQIPYHPCFYHVFTRRSIVKITVYRKLIHFLPYEI